MKYPGSKYYVKAKYHRYRIHPTENVILGLQDKPKSLRIQYQVQNEVQIRKNQKIIRNDKDELIVKNYPKIKRSITQQPNCPSCKRNAWLEIDEGYYCKNCEYVYTKQEHQVNRKVLRQDRDFSTRLNYANKKIRESWMKMVNTT